MDNFQRFSKGFIQLHELKIFLIKILMKENNICWFHIAVKDFQMILYCCLDIQVLRITWTERLCAPLSLLPGSYTGSTTDTGGRV